MSSSRGVRPATVLMALILVVGAGLRLRRIDQPFTDAFSWRQTSTAMMAENFYTKSWNIFFPEVNWTGPGPSYQGREFQTVSYTAALLYVVLGQHEWVGRGVAIGFGLWGIFALYELVCRVWDREHGLASAAAMAVLPGSIFVERSFLPDPAMVALATTSLWMLVAYLEEGRPRHLVLACATGAWALLTKLPGTIVLLPAIYVAIAIGRSGTGSRPRRPLALGLAALAAAAPVGAYYLWAVHLARAYPPHHIAGSGNWITDHGVAEWWTQAWFLPGLVHAMDWLWAQPVLLLVVLGLLVAPRATRAPWVFHFWLLGGALYYFVGAKELVDNPWNFHVLDPAAAALSARAMIRVGSLAAAVVRPVGGPSLGRWVPRAAVAALLVFVAVAGEIKLGYMYRPYADQGYKMGLALRRVSQTGDLVVTVTNAIGDPVAIYYSQRRGWVFPPAREGKSWGELPAQDGESIQLFEGLRAQGAKWLGIVNDQKEGLWREHPALGRHIDGSCRAEQESPDYVLYRILPPAEVATR